MTLKTTDLARRRRLAAAGVGLYVNAYVSDRYQGVMLPVLRISERSLPRRHTRVVLFTNR